MQAVRSFQLSVPISSVGWVPILAFGLRLASPTTADASYLLLGTFALTGRVQAIQALALSWLFTMLSPGIAPTAEYASIGRYGVIAGAALSLLMRSDLLKTQRGPDRLTTLTLLLGGFIIVHSIFFSPLPDVSILKALSWTVVMSTLLTAWSRLSLAETEALESWLYGGLVLIALVSLPLLVLPVGYLRNGTGFQGILNHPQAFGPTMALLAAWTVGRMIARRPPPWTSFGLALLCLAFVVMSETRTAGVALILGVATAVLAAPLVAGRSLRSMAPALQSHRFQALMFAAVLASIAAGSQLTGLVTEFISKSGRAQVSNLLEAYDRSRGAMIDEMWENIEEKPWTGVGFGLASDLYDFNVKRDPILNLPVGAPIEKGVVPVMVLEELGIPGALLVLVWIWFFIRRAATRGIMALSVVAVALLLNSGEAILFSPGGLGLLILLLLSWAVARRQQALRNRPGYVGN